MKYNLKWENIYSGETGYVCKVLKSKGYFVNTYAKEDAKKYVSRSAAQKDIEVLEDLGEAENNNFFIEEAYMFLD